MSASKQEKLVFEARDTSGWFRFGIFLILAAMFFAVALWPVPRERSGMTQLERTPLIDKCAMPLIYPNACDENGQLIKPRRPLKPQDIGIPVARGFMFWIGIIVTYMAYRYARMKSIRGPMLEISPAGIRDLTRHGGALLPWETITHLSSRKVVGYAPRPYGGRAIRIETGEKQVSYRLNRMTVSSALTRIFLWSGSLDLTSALVKGPFDQIEAFAERYLVVSKP